MLHSGPEVYRCPQQSRTYCILNLYFILAYDVATLSKNLDWISLMTYDYHGQWDKKTGHLSPMYEGEDDEDKTLNTVRTARSKMFEISIINVQKTDTCYYFTELLRELLDQQRSVS